jgi:uncharacterized protein (DUF433 family)/DNA-binding transcriptional MerR regulator
MNPAASGSVEERGEVVTDPPYARTMANVTSSLIGRGIYDPTEAARLVRVHPDTLDRWTTGKRPLVTPAFERFFDFEDLVSLLVIAELWRRGVQTSEIRRGVEVLAEVLDVDRPLAHIDAPKRLATVGRSFFANIDQWADAGRGFQLAFQPMIEPVLRPLEYDTHGMAHLWRPLDRVAVTPEVQAGTPCVEATRVPTTTIDGLVRVGEDVEDIAFDLDLEIDQIEAALRFEAALGNRLLGQKTFA